VHSEFETWPARQRVVTVVPKRSDNDEAVVCACCWVWSATHRVRLILDELYFAARVPERVLALVVTLALVGQKVLIVVLDGVTSVISTFTEWKPAESEGFECRLDLGFGSLDPLDGAVSEITTELRVVEGIVPALV
jgi:hypothetical protein